MARIRVPDQFRDCLVISVAADLHVVDVKLSDGRIVRKLAVRGGAFITGFHKDPAGESALDFDRGIVRSCVREELKTAAC